MRAMHRKGLTRWTAAVAVIAALSAANFFESLIRNPMAIITKPTNK